ncbi:MAG: acyl carrier protein [Granulosicoccus sp.]
MSRQDDVYNFIKGIKPDVPDFEPDQNLLESDILDSVAMMELVLWSEGHFGFTVDTDDLTPENFATLDAIMAYVNKQVDSD